MVPELVKVVVFPGAASPPLAPSATNPAEAPAAPPPPPTDCANTPNRPVAPVVKLPLFTTVITPPGPP